MIKKRILSLLETNDILLISDTGMHIHESLKLGLYEVLTGTTRLVSAGRLNPLWNARVVRAVSERLFAEVVEERIANTVPSAHDFVEDNNFPFVLP